MKAVALFSGFLKKHARRRICFVTVLMVLHSATEGISLLLLVPLLGILAEGGTDNTIAQFILQALDWLHIPASIGGILGAFVSLIIVRSCIQLLRERQEAMLQHDVTNTLRFQCFRALLQAEWRWLQTQARSDHINLVMNEVTRLGNGLNTGLRLIAAIVGTGVYLAAALAVSFKAAGFLIFVGGVIFLLLTGLRRQAGRLGQEQGQVNRTMVRNIQESLAGIKLSKILGAENRHYGNLVSAIERVRKAQLDFSLNSSLVRAFLQILGASILAVYIFAGTVWFEIDVPELLTLVVIFGRMLPQFMSTQQLINQLLHIRSAVYEIDTFLKQSKQAAEPVGDSDESAWPVGKQISLENVSLRYDTRDAAALDGVSLVLPVNTTTVLIGHSGSGKSTLADIVMGLVVAETGDLKIDGHPVDAMARKRWRQSVSYVPQDVFLFHDTIRENLLWGNVSASSEALNEALNKAAAEFVFQLPDGLDTVVGDNGLRLSGGERQRLALARALLRQPSLLILDEATSALDMENEARVMSAIANLRGNLTVLLIGHRLSALDQADQVVTLSHGKVDSIQMRNTGVIPDGDAS